MADQRSMYYRLMQTRHHPSVARAMSKIPAVSTWDDHDFGFDDATADDMSGTQMNWASELFRVAWPNGYSRGGKHDSIEHMFS